MAHNLDYWAKSAILNGNECLEIHVIKSKSTSLIEAKDLQLINNLHRLRTAWALARQPRLPLAVRAVLSPPVTAALDAVDQGPLLGLLIGALPPALTRLLGANRAGVTARELNDRGFARYADCMSTRRIRFRRREEDIDLPGG